MAGQPMSGSECIHCGFCLETCPTYVLTGKEEESPRGRILLAHALAENRMPLLRATMAPLDHCLGCLACETACPSGVKYRDILFEARRYADEQGYARHAMERFLLRYVITHPSRLRVLVVFYRVLGVRTLLRGLAKISALPKTWRERGALSPTLETPTRGPAVVPNATGPRAILLRGCAARVFMPGTETAMARLLTRAGYRVERRDRPECCGALAHHAGMHALAKDRAEETVASLGGESDAIVVATAAGCGAHLRDLAAVLPSGPTAVRARELALRVRDLSEALLEAPRPLTFNPALKSTTVVFQDPCHLRHAQGIVDEPRRLLKSAGATLVEAEESDLCCGSAGSYHLANPELSAPLARKKRGVLVATHAETVVTANPGCWMQLRAVWPDAGPRLTTLACFLEERLATDSLPTLAPVHDHGSSSPLETNTP